MAEETVVVNQATETTANQATPAVDAKATGDATGTQTQTAEAKTFTQADIDRIVKERLDRAQRQADEKMAKAQAETEAKALAEQGKFKELYEKQQAELAKSAERIRAMELDTLRRGVAGRLGLPEPLIDRLRGETAEDIEADAKALLAAIPKPPAPNINASGGAGGAPVPGELSEQQKAELAAIYGVNPKYLK